MHFVDQHGGDIAEEGHAAPIRIETSDSVELLRRGQYDVDVLNLSPNVTTKILVARQFRERDAY